jgi:O-antigen/teichoic acid export membrane protein
MVSANKFVIPGTLLFLDQLLVAICNWAYWLIILKFTSTLEIGQATTVYSLVVLISMLTQLGLEYPLLKKSSIQRSQILATTLVIELIISLASLFIVLYFINNLFQESLRGFAWIAIALFMISSPGFVLRFALLGISDVKNILFIDIIGTAIRFMTGYALVSTGFGTFGILLSFLLQGLLITGTTLAVTTRTFGFRLGNMKYAKEIIREGLVNAPSKFSRMLLVSFSVVLLASFGISTSEIGIFYVAFMISVVTASLASSISSMVIPISSMSKVDLSSCSLRIGLSLISPLIAVLIVAPKYILSIMGAEYVSAEIILIILSIGILPSSIVMNAISKFNNLDKSRKLISIGSVQILTFLIVFFFSVPYYGTVGAALSILIAFAASSIPSIIWSDSMSMKYVATSGVAILAGVASGYTVISVVSIHPLVAALTSFGITLISVIVLKNTSITEIGELVGIMIKRR